MPKTAGPASFEVRDAGGPVELVSGPPPYYSTEQQQLPPRRGNMAYAQTKTPWWNARYWRKRTWAIVVTIIVIILVVCIVAPLEVAKANKYPDYTALNYTLSDSCKSKPSNFSKVQFI